MSTPASDDIKRSKAVPVRKLPNRVTQFKEINTSELELEKHNEAYMARYENGLLFTSRQLQGDDSKRSYFIFDGNDLAGIRTGSDGNTDSLLALMKENPDKKLYIRYLPPPVAGKKEMRFFIKEVVEVLGAALNQQHAEFNAEFMKQLKAKGVKDFLKTMGRGELEMGFERLGLDKSLVTIIPDLDFEGNHALHCSHSDSALSFRTPMGETTYYPSLFIYNLFTFWASQVDWSVEDRDTRKCNEVIMNNMKKYFEMNEDVMLSKEEIDESTSAVFKAIAESRKFKMAESKDLFGIADQTITFKQYQDILKKRKLTKVDLRPLGLPENAKEMPAWMGYLGIKIGFVKQFLRFNANQEAVRNVMTRCLKYAAPIEKWVEVEEFLVDHFSKNAGNEEKGGGEEEDEENNVVAVSQFQKKADEAEKRRLEVLKKKALKKGKPLTPVQKPVAQQKQSQIPEIAQYVMNTYIRNNKGQRIEAQNVSTKFGELTIVEVEEPEPTPKIEKEKSLCYQLGYHEDWSQQDHGKEYESNFHHVPLEYRKRHSVKYFMMEKRDMGRPLKSQYLTDVRTYVKSYNIKAVPIRFFKSENREKEDSLFFREDVYDMIECYIDKNTNARLRLFLDEHNQEKTKNTYATVTLNRFTRLMSAFNLDMSKFVVMDDVYRDLTTTRSEIEFFAPIRTLGPDGEIVMNVKQAMFSTFQQVVIGINWTKAEEDLGTETIRTFKDKFFGVMEEYENIDNTYFVSQQHVDKNIQLLQNDEIYKKLFKNVPDCLEKGQDIAQKVDMPVIALNCMAYNLPVTDSSSTRVTLPVHWYHLVFGWIMAFYRGQKPNQKRILAERMCVKAQATCKNIRVHMEWVEKWVKKSSEASEETSEASEDSEDFEDSEEFKHTHCGACCKPLSERPEPEAPPPRAPEASKFSSTPKSKTIPEISEIPPAKKPTVVAETPDAPPLQENKENEATRPNDAKYWRDKCFTAGEHCSEAQKAQKSAEKKAKEYETKAKRTEEVEKEMKKMKKEMEKMKEKYEKMKKELEEANETIQKKREKEMKSREELKSEKQRVKSLEEKNQHLEEALASTSGPFSYKTKLKELMNTKEEFEKRQLRTQAMKIENVLKTESNDPVIKEMVNQEMGIFMKSYEEYLNVLLINIRNLNKFLGTRPLIPLPTEPAISEKLYKAYQDHTNRPKALVEDYECHVCYVRPTPTERTVHCGHAKCKKLMHFKCAKEWYTNNTTSTACMYCKEPFKNINAVKRGL